MNDGAWSVHLLLEEAPLMLVAAVVVAVCTVILLAALRVDVGAPGQAVRNA